MKTICISLFLIALMNVTHRVQAQPDSRFSIGLQGNQMGDKLGIGLNATSPAFLERCAVRVNANLLWADQVDFGTEGWKQTKFWNVRLGLMGSILEFGKRSHLYLEAGFITIIPSTRIPADIGLGAYLQIGVECAITKQLGLFMELGFTGYQTDIKRAILTEIYDENAHFSQLANIGIRFYIP